MTSLIELILNLQKSQRLMEKQLEDSKKSQTLLEKQLEDSNNLIKQLARKIGLVDTLDIEESESESDDDLFPDLEE